MVSANCRGQDVDCFILARDKNRKDQETSSKQSGRLLPETRRSQATNVEIQKLTKRIEIHQITNHKPCFFELVQVDLKHLFAKRSAQIIEGT